VTSASAGAQGSGMGAAVGRHVRRFREARGMSVSELARQAGLSKATLSKLEGGAGNPTIGTVAAIAVALRLPLGDLIPAPVPAEPTVHRGTADPDHSRQELLHRLGPGVLTEIWRLRVRKAGQFIESPAHAPGTVEYILVTRGAMTAGPADGQQELAAGDFIVFPGDVPHRYTATEGPAEASVIMTYPATGRPTLRD
jgi:transcriptional regulator with XRE-family HTH domain